MIVVGAGKVGFDISKWLSDEGHDVTLVDKANENLSEATNHLDVMTLDGNGASPPVLEQAGVDEADILIAVTDIDEVNMIACFTAKQYGVSMCCARVRDPEYSEAFGQESNRRLGIDRVINPDQLSALEIARLLKMPSATSIETFAEGNVTMVRVRVADDSSLVDQPLREIDLKGCLVAAIVRDGNLSIPNGDSVLKPSDRIYLLGHTHNFASLGQIVGYDSPPAKNVVIAGGGKLGVRLAQMLAPKGRRSHQSIKIIEIDSERCESLADLLPHAIIINGDCEKIDVLRDELVGQGDAFVAVTGKDHTNVLATMVAKELGVAQAITKISREDYHPLAERAGADAVIVPRLIAAGVILQLVRRSNLINVALIEDGDGEVLEFDVGEDAQTVNKRLIELPRMENAIIGSIMRNDRVMIPSGDSTILPGDRVIVFALPSAVPTVMRQFGGPGRELS